MAQKKMIITWEDKNINIALEGDKPLPTIELVGVLEYAKLILFENKEKQED